MIRAQKESIDTLKQMLSQLLKEKKKPTGKTPSNKSKVKGRKEKTHLLQILRVKSIPTLSPPYLRLKRKITQKMKSVILR